MAESENTSVDRDFETKKGERIIDCNVEIKSFRVNRNKLCLTYSQTGEATKEELLSFLQGLGSIKTYCISQEEHETTGGWHLHAAVWYTEKLDIKRRDKLFFNGKGPCLRYCWNYDGYVGYVKKKGDYIEGEEVFDDSTSKNWTKRLADFEARKEYLEDKKRQAVTWPIKLLDGSEFDPTNLGKKKNLWMVGTPDLGKTKWLQDTFEGKRIFNRRNNKYPYEGYQGEEVIFMDDALPSFSEIAHMTQFYKIKTPVFGETRYKNYWMPLKTNIVFIVISNCEPDYGNLQEAFLSRFNIVRL